jgi:hypothetical protein
MKTYVRFGELGTSASGKTKIWSVKNTTSDFQVGRIVWYSNWRKYVFEPAANCLFDIGCLTEIVDFIKTATMEHKLRGEG